MFLKYKSLNIQRLFPKGPGTGPLLTDIISFLNIYEITQMGLVCKAFSRSQKAAILCRNNFSEDEYYKMLDLKNGASENVLFQVINSPSIDFQKSIKSFLGEHDIFIYSCYKGYSKCVTCLLYHIKHPSSKSLVWSVYNNHYDVVKLLLEDTRIKPNYDHNSPLRIACAEGHNEIVKELLNNKAVDPTDFNSACIELAVEHKRGEVVKTLMLDGRVDPKRVIDKSLDLMYKIEKKILIEKENIGKKQTITRI